MCDLKSSFFDGKCTLNTDLVDRTPIPPLCANVAFNDTSLEYLCSGCEYWFALASDQKSCLINSGPSAG
jgi:hypothetical protein